MRLIDADLFDKVLADAQEKCKKSGGNFRYGVLSNVRANLLKQPTVDALPVVHGKWIHPDQQEEKLISGICSHCRWEAHYYEDDVVDMPYCPNCGARMDLEEQNDE